MAGKAKNDMTYETALSKVIDGAKRGMPIITTLARIKFCRTKFYKEVDAKTLRHLNELKCLKSPDRTNKKYSRNDPLADFNSFDI